MRKPIIGILGRVDQDQDGDQLFASYEKARIAVLASGGIPLLLLPTQLVKYYEYKNSELPPLTSEEKEMLCRELDLCDALLVPGGYRWYVNYDVFLALEAIHRNMPVLGICAGMQLLGTLFYDKRVIFKNEGSINHHQRNVKQAHGITVLPNTKLAGMVKVHNIQVNSLHRYHLEQAPNYVVNAISEDGLIEGIELPDKDYVMGVQWHPESMLDYEPTAKILLRRFTQAAVSYQKKR